MKTYTDINLKQALAKMFPTTILDIELCHLCWLVEETLDDDQILDYVRYLCDGKIDAKYWREWYCAHASWQQRVIALAEVKGIEIV